LELREVNGVKTSNIQHPTPNIECQRKRARQGVEGGGKTFNIQPFVAKVMQGRHPTPNIESKKQRKTDTPARLRHRLRRGERCVPTLFGVPGLRSKMEDG
jgi:hypothetical protein